MLGTSGWVVLCAAVAVFAVQRWFTNDRIRALQYGVTFFILIALPLAIPVPHAGDNVGGVANAPMAIVQGGTPATGMNAFDVRRAVLDNHVRESMKLAIAMDHGEVVTPVFVLWPENASDLDPYRDQGAAAAIGVATRAIGVPILVGAVVGNPQDPSTVLNAGILWDPIRGAVQEYDKKHPVPFGEYIPFRAQLAPLINRFDRIGHDFAAGTKSGIFSVGDISAGNVICFEVAYNSVTDPLLDQGARVVTVQTNNATYAGTAQPAQQFMIERMRALQMGRSVVVAATTGISAFIGPDGVVQASMGEGQTGSLVRSVALRGERNLGSYLGPIVVFVWGFGALIAVLVPTARAIRARSKRRHKVVQ
jgi:apolipoprotein N-acyltransferase